MTGSAQIILNNAKSKKGQAYSLGLSSTLLTLSGQSSSWTLYNTASIAAYAGATVQVVGHYTNGTTGTSYRGDIQLDYFNFDNQTYSFETNNNGFETSIASSNTATYSSVSWTSIPSSGNGQFLRDSGGTPSSGTGLTTAYSGSFYIYAETSGQVLGKNFWFRGPQLVLSSNPTLQVAVARYGDNIGTLKIYLDAVA